MKKLSVIILSIILCISMTACGKTQPEAAEGTDGENATAQTESEGAEEEKYLTQKERVEQRILAAYKEIEEAKANGTYVEPKQESEITPPTADNLLTNPLSHIDWVYEEVDGELERTTVTTEYLGNDRWRDRNGRIWRAYENPNSGEFRMFSIGT